MRRFVPALSLLVIGAFSQGSAAADTAARCVAIEDPQARLACYDAAHGRSELNEAAARDAEPSGAVPAAGVAPTAGAAAGEPAKAAVATPGSTSQDFGLSEAQKARVERAPTEITAKVLAVGRTAVPGRWSVTLENGQVWEQVETTAAARKPRVGDTVSVRKAALGSYLLNSPNTGNSRVKRVR